MPIIKSAIKRAKQTIKRRDRNVAVKRDLRNAIKNFTDKPSTTTLSAAQSEIDKAVKKNILEKNTAARRKAILARTAKEAGVKLTKATAKKPAATTTKKPVAKKASVKKPMVKKPTTKKPAAKKTIK